jgi:hypothetical protein
MLQPIEVNILNKSQIKIPNYVYIHTIRCKYVNKGRKFCMKKKLIGIFIFTLLFGISISPIISAENNSPIKGEVRNDNNSTLSESEGFFDILLFRARGQIVYPFLTILDGLKPQLSIGIIFWNFNQHSIFVDYHLKIIGTREDIVLIDMNFTDNEIHPQNGLAASIGNFRVEEYTFGPFEVVLTVHNQNANRDKTVVYYGFVFELGTIIFNSRFKLI